MWIVCNNIFVSNSVGGYAFSSRHSPPPAPDQRPYVKVNPTLVSISYLLHGPCCWGGGEGEEGVNSFRSLSRVIFTVPPNSKFQLI